MTKLKIDLPQKRNKISVHLKENSIHILNEYRSYLSEIHDTEITYELVLDALIQNIEKDKEFKKFRTASASKKPNVTGATVKQKIENEVSNTSENVLNN